MYILGYLLTIFLIVVGFVFLKKSKPSKLFVISSLLLSLVILVITLFLIVLNPKSNMVNAEKKVVVSTVDVEASVKKKIAETPEAEKPTLIEQPNLPLSTKASPLPIEQQETLKIGVVDIIPPYVYYNKNKQFVGLEVDIATSMAKSLNKIPLFIMIKPEDVIKSLNSNKVDMVLGGLKIGEIPSKYVDYLDSYMNSSIVLYSNKNNAKFTQYLNPKPSANDLKMLSEKSVGAQLYKEDFNFVTKKFAKTPILIKSYTKQMELIKDVEKGKTSFGVSDKEVITYYLSSNPKSKITIANITLNTKRTKVSFVVAKGSPLKDLLKAQ